MVDRAAGYHRRGTAPLSPVVLGLAVSHRSTISKPSTFSFLFNGPVS